VGVCGTCKVLKHSGDVESDASASIDAEEVRAGYVLTCVSRARGRVELDA
jgi:ferredoxin